MFEIIAIIAVVLAVAIAVILILAATKPNTFSFQLATTIKAPPDKIFPPPSSQCCRRAMPLM